VPESPPSTCGSVSYDACHSLTVSMLERRVVPTLAALPADVPLVLLADHGFRDNASGGTVRAVATAVEACRSRSAWCPSPSLPLGDSA